MNAVEIEQAISESALQPFDATEFPYAFLAAFGNKEVTLKRLRSGNNTSDLPNGVQHTQDGSTTEVVYDLETARLVASVRASYKDE
jgi:hypothetical protein